MLKINKYPDENVVISILANNESPAYLLASIVFGKEVELPYHHKKISINPKILADYVGEYEGIKIYLKDDKLYYSDYYIELIPELPTY